MATGGTASTVAAEAIPLVVQRIVERFHPLRVVLFGSHARGDARPDSDVDLLVVLAEVGNRREATVEILRTLSDLRVAVDVVVATPEEMERCGNIVGTVFRPALREGRVLYEC